MADLNEEEVKQRAYQLWEQEGCPEGREFQNYMDAVAQIMAEQESEGTMRAEGGISSGLHPGGVAPAGGASFVGSMGTGGAASGPTGTRNNRSSAR